MSTLGTRAGTCTRRREVTRQGVTVAVAACPGAVGFCAGCPNVPWSAQCEACGAETPIRDVEHANRVTGGFGCGADYCPPRLPRVWWT